MVLFIISLLAVALITHKFITTNDQPQGDMLDFFVGVEVAYENVTEIKQLVDEISNYTNLMVIGCTGITYDSNKLTEVCQYVYDKGLSFIIYSDMPPLAEESFLYTQLDCVNEWGDKFLGIYAFDEGGGRQLDQFSPRQFRVDEADNITDAADKFVYNATLRMEWFTQGYTSSTSFPLYTSDYALYWFDYQAGYDVVLAEFGWNYSRELNIALCRGAAAVQNKDWGVTITWTYNEPPYIESGEELYDDMVLAYENGAKYILLFDTNENYTGGILEEEHLNAMKEFWEYAQNNPRTADSLSDRVAYVLPEGYGYGFRGPADKIWGLWEADQFALDLCTEIGELLEAHKPCFDIIYDDELNATNTAMYNELIYWNGTIITR